MLKVVSSITDILMVLDECMGKTCIDNAFCNRLTGKCECNDTLVAHGAACVTKDCVGVLCGPHSFCEKGLCYCRIGYHPNVDRCIPGLSVLLETI